MKTYKYILLFISLLFISSCSNDPISISHDVNISIITSNVLKNFQPYDPSNLDMYSEDNNKSSLRVTALIYGPDGQLVHKDEFLKSNYDGEHSFSFKTNERSEEYTIVCFSSSILGTLSSPEIESYSFQNINDINSLSVIQNYFNSFSSSWSILGGAVQKFNNHDESVRVNLSPITSLVYLEWTNIHSYENNNENEEDDSIFGDYTANTYDYWENNRYEWTITVKEDNSLSGGIIIENLDPYAYGNGISSDKGANIFKGYINSDRIVIPMKQNVGWKYKDEDVFLVGGRISGSSLYFEDLEMQIYEDKLVTTNHFGTCTATGDGMLSLFPPEVVFQKSKTNSGGSDKIIQYVTIFHNNDKLMIDGMSFKYYTSLDATSNNGHSMTVNYYPDSNNVYSMINLLPGTFDIFERMFIDEINNGDYGDQTITVKEGSQYVITFDCEDNTLTFLEGVLKSGLIIFDDSDKIQSTSIFLNDDMLFHK